MDIKDFRKNIFINSQYCNYYIDKNCTVLAGIMRDIGYKYDFKLSDEILKQVDTTYRKFTTLINTIVAVEILIYVYLFVFPYFTKLMNLPFFVAAMVLSFIPLIFLYLTYIVVNAFYQKYIFQHIGKAKKVKFSPNIYNIEPKAFEKYKSAHRKSVYIVTAILCLFLFYVFTPLGIDKLVTIEKYNSAIKLANIYTKVIPISADVYALRAYSKFKLKNYEASVDDYKKANEYSLSNEFDYDILGVKTYYKPFDEIIKVLDDFISKEDNKIRRQFLLSEKALYLLRNNKYNDALKIYDELLVSYIKREDTGFCPEEIYYNRSIIKAKLGDFSGAQADKAISNKMCLDCSYSLDTKLVNLP